MARLPCRALGRFGGLLRERRWWAYRPGWSLVWVSLLGPLTGSGKFREVPPKCWEVQKTGMGGHARTPWAQDCPLSMVLNGLCTRRLTAVKAGGRMAVREDLPSQGSGWGGDLYLLQSQDPQNSTLLLENLASPTPFHSLGRGTARGCINLRDLGSGRGTSEWPQP